MTAFSAGLMAIRPDSWNFPLLLHVLGAMILVGGLFGGAIALLAGTRARLLQGLGFRILLFAALPGYVLMLAGAEWIASKEGFGGGDHPTWYDIGIVTADAGALVLLAALIVGGLGARRARAEGGRGLTVGAGVLSALLLVTYVVTVWAMSAKPD
jgi:hypothetical protein